MRLWITEKPDQAKALAPLLGNPKRGSGCIQTDDGVVTWAFGHILREAMPEQYNDAWVKWDIAQLPMVPAQWLLVPSPDKADQLKAVGKLLREASEVVIATDPGAEGEAIARNILAHFKYRGRVMRLWYNATDERTLRKALADLRPGDSTLPLYYAAQARTWADWLWGLNGTRFYTLKARAAGEREIRTVGRVQSPTLALVVRRDLEIEGFRSRTYYELAVDVRTPSGASVTLKHAPGQDQRIFERDQAQALAQACSGQSAPLKVTNAEKTTAPPKLFSLSRLQAATSKAWGWAADKTLEVAQALYDKHLTTYPRTAATYLPDEQAPDVPVIVKMLGNVPPLARLSAYLTVNAPLVRDTVFSTKKLAGEEHHAIIPTTQAPVAADLSSDERDLYFMVARQYLAALMPDYRFASTKIELEAAGVQFAVTGTTPLDQGWRSAFAGADPEKNDEDEDTDNAKLPPIANGAPGKLGDVAILPKQTKAPPRYTEGALITDMTSIAKFATDPAVKARLREASGIGTEATRSNIIANLRERGYLQPQGKHIVSTPLGRAHHAAIDPRLTDPAMTALWEDVLVDLRQGKGGIELRDTFVRRTIETLQKLVDRERGTITAALANRPPTSQALDYARKLAAALGVELPAQAATSGEACKAFIDQAVPKAAALPPSDKSVSFAEKLAKEAGIELPIDCRQSRAACSAFIDAHTTGGGKAKGKSKSKGQSKSASSKTKGRSK